MRPLSRGPLAREFYLRAALLCLGPLIGLQNAWAFPELVRHGYVNCTTCHVSPTGGGVVTPYGRELSKEVLSITGKDGETKYAYFIESPEWLALGGDFRAVQTYRDSPTNRQGRLIFMQSDLEAAASYKHLSLVSTLGYRDTPLGQSSGNGLISRRHYGLYHLTDEASLRAGRFFPAYGLNVPEHTLLIRRGLQLNDQEQETYNVEGAWLGESLNFYATGVFGRPDASELNRDRGLSLVASVAFAERYRTGMSYYYGSNPTQARQIFGPYGILGFTPKFFLLTEWDFKTTQQKPSELRQSGVAIYNRLNYEFFQGFHGYLDQELLRSDFKSPDTVTKSYGLGLQIFPRPHFEINLAWQILVRAGIEGYTDNAWLMLHFYP